MELLNNESNLNETKLYKCSFAGCSASFSRAFRYSRHIRSHKGERPFICDIEGCDKSFTCKSYLNKHKKRPHTGVNSESDCDIVISTRKREKRHNCEQCCKEFKTKFLLKTHIAEHTGEKPFKCDKCDASFALKSRLTRHQKRHQGYPCNQDGCQLIAETWSQLRKHIAQVHKCNHKCECGRVFTTKFNLKVHQDRHKFNCSIDGCIKSFVRKCHLKDHLNSDHSSEKLTCLYKECNAKFEDNLIFAQHLISHSRDSEKIKNPIIFTHRKSFAQELSGYSINRDDLSNILNRDKEFRRELSKPV